MLTVPINQCLWKLQRKFNTLFLNPLFKAPAFWFSDEEIHRQPCICYNHNKIDFGVGVKVISQPTKSNSFVPIKLPQMKIKKKIMNKLNSFYGGDCHKYP